jgi:ABC-type uncharacterized transport system permease subunit
MEVAGGRRTTIAHLACIPSILLVFVAVKVGFGNAGVDHTQLRHISSDIVYVAMAVMNARKDVSHSSNSLSRKELVEGQSDLSS